MKKSGTGKRGSRSPTDIDRLVGENLRRLRLRRNLTLAHLAAELGLSHQQLQKYETGVNRLSAGMVCAAADALGVSIGALFQTEAPAKAKSRTSRPDALDALRAEGHYWLGRAETEPKLRQMIQVLKALSSNA